MINALHLIWIIPLSASFGLFITALMVAGRDDKERKEREEKKG